MLEQIAIPTSRRFGTLSPLRYPGGKASLAGLFADLIAELGMHGATYVEPYAGGAGAGIALLREGIIDHLVINDFDKAVYAFWHSVTHHNDDLVGLVRDAELNVREWRRQREIYSEGDIADLLKLGFAFFYLNRTNRSGVLRAGVIGGNAQTGNYLIDARYNPYTLADRIRALGELAGQITVIRKDRRTVIREYGSNPDAFLYVDPLMSGLALAFT
ncbi:MAG: DNA adenine methylase [Bifidobacteriaceae bacterium]|jgi:DNA adenine methylase|nr:DNA adenine methylase [Bifidobacteriaceae bacterium]